MPSRPLRLSWWPLTVALVVISLLAGCGDEGQSAPATSAANATELRDGGPEAFKRELARLRGTPVVVNQWASWCGPCRLEFPFFQRLAERYKGRVAFLGVDSQDSREDARRFLERFPTSFPHFYDRDTRVARVFRGGRSWPTTAYYTADGSLSYTHQGAYATEGKLVEDIKRYALDG